MMLPEPTRWVRFKATFFRFWEMPSRKLADIKAFYQRGKRGFAERDAWDADTYLARLISEMLDYLAQHNDGFPAFSTQDVLEISDYSEEEELKRHGAWNCRLLALAESFRKYAEVRSEAPQEEIKSLLAQMAEIIPNWPNLWV